MRFLRRSCGSELRQRRRMVSNSALMSAADLPSRGSSEVSRVRAADLAATFRGALRYLDLDLTLVHSSFSALSASGLGEFEAADILE